LAKAPRESALITKSSDDVKKYFLNVLITYLSVLVALGVSLWVFVKKRRPPKPAFFVLSFDGYGFIKAFYALVA
jgi:hypothetical protein